MHLFEHNCVFCKSIHQENRERVREKQGGRKKSALCVGEAEYTSENIFIPRRQSVVEEDTINIYFISQFSLVSLALLLKKMEQLRFSQYHLTFLQNLNNKSLWAFLLCYRCEVIFVDSELHHCPHISQHAFEVPLLISWWVIFELVWVTEAPVESRLDCSLWVCVKWKVQGSWGEDIYQVSIEI